MNFRSIQMKKIALAILFIFMAIAFIFYFGKDKNKIETVKEILTEPVGSPKVEKRTWSIKSIDTMKYSRDTAGEKLNDLTFDATIDLHVKSIADLGATHVAIGTPYDERFTPFLSRWVAAARRHNLKVWFRGNFAGWEGWFGYEKKLIREEHLSLMRQFINKNGHLFENGDLFTPCPECENGGAGDPRRTGDVDGFRQFIVKEFQAANAEFRTVGKNVRTVSSMNYDVASLVMDEQTANAVGDLVVVDHYVDKPHKLAADIITLSQKVKSKIMLGEFGVPIPDIHGKLSDEEQAQWIDESLNLIQSQEEVIGLNYWTSFGGSTAIFNNAGSEKAAAKVLEKYFKLESLPIP